MSTASAAEWLDRRFSPREKVELGLEIVVAYARARWWLWRTDLPRTVTALRPATRLERGRRRRSGACGVPTWAWVVGQTLRHLPFDSRCLMRSLVLTSLLARRGIASTLVIAVRSDPEFARARVGRSTGRAASPAGRSAVPAASSRSERRVTVPG